MNPRGRPTKFKDADELEKMIEEYFANITITYPLFDTVPDGKDAEGKELFKKTPRFNNAGNHIYKTDYIEIPSILSLCISLEVDRSTLIRYEQQEEFCNTIKKAKEKIEEYVEKQLYRKDQVTGIIFNLKNNFNWTDKQEIESHNINENIELTAEDRQKRIDELMQKREK